MTREITRTTASAAETSDSVPENGAIAVDEPTGSLRFQAYLDEIEQARDALLKAEDGFCWQGVQFHQTTLRAQTIPFVL